MKKVFVVTAVLALLCVSVTAQAGTLIWTFTNAADYYVEGGGVTSGGIYVPVITVGIGAYVPPRPWINSDDNPPYGSDWASVFAKINTQAFHLEVGDITGGGFTLSGMNHPDAVYGSLYLSPTGGASSTVLINISPMGRTGTGGSYVYTFGLDTSADVLIYGAGGWSGAQYSGTFGGAINWVNSSAYSGTYAAFFGPQIGMSNTSETTFTVSEIELSAVPEPSLILLLGMGLGAVSLIAWRFRA